MSRIFPRSLRHPLVVLLALVATSCGGATPEEQLLTNFFRASRVRDNATLANIAAVQFNPRTDGSVQNFEVISVSPEERRSLQIQQTLAAVDEAKIAEGEFAKRKRAYQDANMPALQRISQAQRDKQPIKGPEAAVLEAWNKLSAEELETKKRASQARTKAAQESSIAIGSLTAPGRPDVDVKGMEVEVVTKRVTVNAQVNTPDGQTTPKTLIFTMQRAVGQKDGQTTEGRWIITGLEPQG